MLMWTTWTASHCCWSAQHIRLGQLPAAHAAQQHPMLALVEQHRQGCQEVGKELPDALHDVGGQNAGHLVRAAHKGDVRLSPQGCLQRHAVEHL